MITVIAIILCSLVGTIAMLAFCGCVMWSFVYMIRYRLLKREVTQKRYTTSRTHDFAAVTIALLALAGTSVLLAFGLPFVAEHISELPLPTLP